MAAGQMITGTVTVTTSGTPVPLSTTPNLYVQDLKVMGNSANAGGVVVGDASVAIAGATQRGVYAGKGSSSVSPHVTIAGPVDLSTVYVDASNGDKAIFSAIECKPPGA